MFFNSYLLISLRYLQASNKNSTIKTMIKICFGGIFIGTFALALIVSIMKGFEQATYKKMQTIYPQIIIDADGDEINIEPIEKILNQSDYHVHAFSPQQYTQALLTNVDNEETPHVIQLRSVNPKQEAEVTSIKNMILPKNQNHPLDQLIHNQQIIIGKKLAEQLHLSTGSPAHILFTDNQNISRKVKFNQKKVFISGIFETGIDEFDTNLIYCSHQFFNSIFPDEGITQIYLQFDEKVDEKSAIKKLKSRLKLNVYSWKKLYTTLVSALELEKYAMFIILLLIVLVASSNIISLLFMQITQKNKDIALFASLGLQSYQIRNIFLFVSMSISIIASSAGLIAAYFMGLFLQNYRWITLPDNIYYTSHLPVCMDFPLFLLIFFAVLSISLVASLIPIKNIKIINVATFLRNET